MATLCFRKLSKALSFFWIPQKCSNFPMESKRSWKLLKALQKWRHKCDVVFRLHTLDVQFSVYLKTLWLDFASSHEFIKFTQLSPHKSLKFRDFKAPAYLPAIHRRLTEILLLLGNFSKSIYSVISWLSAVLGFSATQQNFSKNAEIPYER